MAALVAALLTGCGGSSGGEAPKNAQASGTKPAIERDFRKASNLEAGIKAAVPPEDIMGAAYMGEEAITDVSCREMQPLIFGCEITLDNRLPVSGMFDIAPDGTTFSLRTGMAGNTTPCASGGGGDVTLPGSTEPLPSC